MPIQAVLFPKHFSILQIKNFLNEHNLKQLKPIHETMRFKRVRILEQPKRGLGSRSSPLGLNEPNFKRYSTKQLPNGVDLILGYD